MENGSRFLFTGDSITDFGRARPVGEGEFGGLGTSYVSLADALIKTSLPGSRIRVLNTGVGGDTTRHLLKRWKTDVLDLHPDWLSILIGINDVWRHYDCPLQTEIHIGPEEYQSNLEEMIAAAAPGLKGLILMTPYYMEANREDPMRRQMEEYADIVRHLAKRHGAVLVDLQSAFDEYFESCHPVSVNMDRVHPNLIGHMLIARKLLTALGMDVG